MAGSQVQPHIALPHLNLVHSPNWDCPLPAPQTTLLQFHLVSSILPQSLTSFFGIFYLDVIFTNMNFSSFIIAWRKWNVMIYTARRCCLILKWSSELQFAKRSVQNSVWAITTNNGWN